MAKKKKKNGKLKFIFLILLLIFSMFIGKKFAEYTWGSSGEDISNKYSKPIADSKNPLEGVSTGEGAGNEKVIPEDDMVSITSLVMEFVAAEHMKKADKLALLVDANYYNTLIKRVNQLKAGEAGIEDLDYQQIDRDTVKVKVKYIINSKAGYETITLKLLDNVWKISRVEA